MPPQALTLWQAALAAQLPPARLAAAAAGCRLRLRLRWLLRPHGGSQRRGLHRADRPQQRHVLQAHLAPPAVRGGEGGTPGVAAPSQRDRIDNTGHRACEARSQTAEELRRPNVLAGEFAHRSWCWPGTCAGAASPSNRTGLCARRLLLWRAPLDATAALPALRPPRLALQRWPGRIWVGDQRGESVCRVWLMWEDFKVLEPDKNMHERELHRS